MWQGCSEGFIFATGIECSNPSTAGGTLRRDLLGECGHYERWEQDLDLVRGLGLRYLRYGLPIHRTMPAPDRYDWSFSDLVLGRMRELGIVPILDLLHFGLPDWMGTFQNPDFPQAFARYAAAVADRYPWVQMWTPVNEIFVSAKLSAREGFWNEQARDDASFLRAVKNLVRASLLATGEIVRRCPDAVIIPSESVEIVHACAPVPCERTRLFNELRFLSLDLLYGRPMSPALRAWAREHGLTDEEAAWFERAPRPGVHVLGLDYYGHNEFVGRPCGAMVPSSHDGVHGFARLAEEYHRRYGLPLMLTETNYLNAEKAPQWLWKMWMECLRLRAGGVPLIGFCWYSLGDQIDWDTALSEKNDRVNGCGLYRMDRTPNPVEADFRQLLAHYAGLPMFPAAAQGAVPATA